MMSASNQRKRKVNEAAELTIRPASDWISFLWNENKNNAEKMERLQQSLLRGDSRVTGALPFRDKGTYHEMVLPYWRAFVKAGENEGFLGGFSACGVQLSSEVWTIITPKICNIKTLRLENTDMNAEAIRSLSSFISENGTLEEIAFEGNDITDLGAAQALSLAMKKHQTLRKFHAVYCEFGGNYHTEEPDPGQPEIAKAIIDGCENLVEVSMCRVGMDDSCASTYASMIRRNKKLRNLSIFWEYFSRAGSAEIAKGVNDTSSLNAIADSNHKCTIYDCEELDDPNRDASTKMVYVNGLDCPDALKIRYKVQRALFGVGSEPLLDMDNPTVITATEGKEMDLAYLRGIPLGVVPKVLEYLLKERMVVGHEYDFDGYYIKRSWFMHYEEDGKEYLNRLFQAFKGWVVPRLFGS